PATASIDAELVRRRRCAVLMFPPWLTHSGYFPGRPRRICAASRSAAMTLNRGCPCAGISHRYCPLLFQKDIVGNGRVLPRCPRARPGGTGRRQLGVARTIYVPPG